MASVFAAAGAAAALAASFTAVVVPVGGALAAPPTVQVDVTNPATNPALTRSVDDPGRIAYQSAAACVSDQNTCSFNFSAVPKNHRLVVQHVSVGLALLANGTRGQVSLEGGANGGFSDFSFQPPIFFVDQPVLVYFDAGSAPFVFAETDVGLSSNSDATISGYLLDCATTPCAAIAQ